MDDFNSETDSDYTSYWRDWVGTRLSYTRTCQGATYYRLASTMVVFSHAHYGHFLLAWYVDMVTHVEQL
jgi:hypothetical protein